MRADVGRTWKPAVYCLATTRGRSCLCPLKTPPQGCWGRAPPVSHKPCESRVGKLPRFLKQAKLILSLNQACFFTDFAAIQDNGISLILSLEKTSLSLGENSLSLGGKFLSFRKSTWVLKKILEFWEKRLQFMKRITCATYGCHI